VEIGVHDDRQRVVAAGRDAIVVIKASVRRSGSPSGAGMMPTTLGFAIAFAIVQAERAQNFWLLQNAAWAEQASDRRTAASRELCTRTMSLASTCTAPRRHGLPRRLNRGCPYCTT
jgi:hypothetical protein